MNSPADDRNLLFAVLALQADCLSQEQFVEACTLWASQKETPLADLVVQRGWLTADDRADVERLVERKLKKHSNQAQAALYEVTTDHVRQSLQGLPSKYLQHLAPDEPDNLLVSTSLYQPEGRDRYTITRLHATGGIGRVWLAHDDRLGRDVALKELRPESSGNTAVWARFLKEARITGQLEHPSIVPVYELGKRDGDEQPFYTMRFVKGRTFREAINYYHQQRERNELGALDLRELLQAFVGICRAVAYAHSRGVVHRDLKPANVVLGDFGEVMVLDWGIAKVVGESEQATAEPIHDEPGEGLQRTMQGQVLGTPAYMAPEQADGRLDLIDARTDVYGLGAILYELLTNKTPFTGTTTQEVLNRVRHEQPIRPRSHVRTVPPALEAIALRCLAKLSEQRYATAQDVAADVLHFLADEPVTAYREPWSVRGRRWAKRHRVLVTSTFAAFVIAVPILATSVVLLNRSSQRERQAKETAQQNYIQTLRSADLMAGELARGVRPLVGTQRQTVMEMLGRARQVYDELALAPDAPPAVRRGQANTWLLFAELYRDTNQSVKGLDACDRATAIFDELLAGPDGTKEDRIGRAKVLHRRAWLRMDQGYEDDSIQLFRECIQELEQHTDDPVLTAAFLASAHTMVGNILRDYGTFSQAQTHYDRGLELRRRADQQKPGDVDIRIGLGLSLEKAGAFRNAVGDVDEGLKMVRDACEIYRALCAADIHNSELHLHYVRALTSLTQFRRVPDEEIDACHATAFAITERFAQRDPSHALWERELLRQRFYRQEAEGKRGEQTPERRLRDAKAKYEFHQAMVASMERRRREDPENYFWLADVANLQGRSGKAFLELGKLDAKITPGPRALALAQASITDYMPVMERSPKNLMHRMGYDYAQWLVVEALMEQKKDAEAFRVGWATALESTRYFAARYRDEPTSDYIRQELRRVATFRNAFLTAPRLTELLDANPKLALGDAFSPLLRYMTDIPVDASPGLRESLQFGQKRLAPMGRILAERGQLSAEDQARVAKLPQE